MPFLGKMLDRIRISLASNGSLIIKQQTELEKFGRGDSMGLTDDSRNIMGIYLLYMIWLVVWNICSFSIYWEESSQLTSLYFSEG